MSDRKKNKTGASGFEEIVVLVRGPSRREKQRGGRCGHERSRLHVLFRCFEHWNNLANQLFDLGAVAGITIGRCSSALEARLNVDKTSWCVPAGTR